LLICGDPFRMLSVIQLDNQHFLDTAKVGDKRPDRMLTAKLYAIELTTSQMPAQFTLDISLILSQIPRAAFLQ